MGPNSNGGPCRSHGVPPLNVFALVIYIPEPLGGFLDDLRRELVPHYNPHAHVSVLPPRPLQVDWQSASRQARASIEGIAPFEVELTSIQVFQQTNVIYIEVGAGAAELYGLHSAMNRSALAYQEPFEYHPHITLAQEIPIDRVGEQTDLARRRWREYTGPRHFRADRAVFVQNATGTCWVDLADFVLGAVAVQK
jgi:2'-5' RNA ligase